MLELVGWLGSACFAICCIPQAVQCYKEKHARGIDWLFLILWFLGEVFTIVYVWPKADWPLLFNYFGNLMFLSVILWYKVKGS